MKFARAGQETKYLTSYFWNRARIKKDLFKFSLTGQKSRILTIQILFQEEIKITQEARNMITNFKRINIKNQDRILTLNPSKYVHLYLYLLNMKKHDCNSEKNLKFI